MSADALDPYNEYQRRLGLTRGQKNHSADDWHKLGMAASQLAESLWFTERSQAISYWRQASICFARALRLSEEGTERYFEILCYDLLNQARASRHDSNPKVLAKVQDRVERLLRDARVTKYVRGIMLHVLASAQCGSILGFPGTPDLKTARESFYAALQELEALPPTERSVRALRDVHRTLQIVAQSQGIARLTALDPLQLK